MKEMSTRFKKEKIDLVINATIPMYVNQIMQAAYQARVNYLDMASNEIYPRPEIPIEQRQYARQWEQAGLKCLTGAGGDPGLTNIMAKDAVLELDEIDSIKNKDYGIAECDEPVVHAHLSGGPLSAGHNMEKRKAPAGRPAGSAGKENHSPPDHP
jgi:hypothetical protein